MAGSWVRADCPPGRRFLLPGGRFPLPAGGLPRRGLLSSGRCARAARPVSRVTGSTPAMSYRSTAVRSDLR
jgi:hypothetical protein